MDNQTQKQQDRTEKVTAFMVFIAVVAILGYACAGGINNKLTPAMSSLLAFFNETRVWGATLSSIMSFSQLILILPIGFLAIRFGLKWIGAAGLGIMGVGSLLSAFATDTTVFTLLRCVEALGYVCMFCVSKSLIAEWFPADKRGIPMGFCSAGIGIGSIITINTGNLLMPSFGWQGLWVAMAILSFALCACFVFGVKDKTDRASREAEAAAKNEKKESAPISEIFKMPGVWVIALVFAFWGMAQKGYAPFSTMLYTEQAGLDAATANFISSLNPLGQILGALIASTIFSKLKKGRGLWFIITIVVAYTVWFFVFSVSSPIGATFFAFGCGFFGIFVTACITLMIPEHASYQKYIPLAISMMTVCMGIGGILGPYLVAFIQEATGTWSSLRFLMLGLGAASLVCGIIAWRLDVKRYWSEPDGQKASYELVEAREDAKRAAKANR